MGLGRVALQFIKDAILNFPIWVSPNDGNIREDGSHLTGDALGFVKKMIEEKLIDGYDDGSHTQGEDG